MGGVNFTEQFDVSPDGDELCRSFLVTDVWQGNNTYVRQPQR